MIDLLDKLPLVPKKPGVYKFFDQQGKVLYIGKAKNLKNRLTQYLHFTDKRPQLPFLMPKVVNFDYVIVNSELESLFLESTLIQKYLPPYNIMLRDDKSYAFIKIDYTSPIPQITYSRQITTEKKSSLQLRAKYFGPYSSVKKIKKILEIIGRAFPYCTNKSVGARPCFSYFLKRCDGVCIGEVALNKYLEHFANIPSFLSGNNADLTKFLRTEMRRASTIQQFEKAARLRDRVSVIEEMGKKQLTIFTKKISLDVISIFSDGTDGSINLFKVRNGKLLDKEVFLYKSPPYLTKPYQNQAILQTHLENYYATTTDFPQQIIIELLPTNLPIIKKLLKLKSKHTISITKPQRGQKLKLIKLGRTNAEENLRQFKANFITDSNNLYNILTHLQSLLKLPTLPLRIECYDISNTQGTNPVGSMVVFIKGLPVKNLYRKFKINRKQTPDDFAMMAEILDRRLARIFALNPQDRWPQPDLIIIDGGKGQLNTILNIFKKYNIKIPIIGLAKKNEEIFLPNRTKAILLPNNSPTLHLLQRLRDEAHRFGITFHKNLRQKQAHASILDEISGIGPQTKKILKKYFGTVNNIRQSSLLELAKIVGHSKAIKIKEILT